MGIWTERCEAYRAEASAVPHDPLVRRGRDEVGPRPGRLAVLGLRQPCRSASTWSRKVSVPSSASRRARTPIG
ncbi:hypothetical protein SRB17_52370 [Streptomyces sp. RB17]|nr:hypothetical protein [Streptomyces sp. RB17]